MDQRTFCPPEEQASGTSSEQVKDIVQVSNGLAELSLHNVVDCVINDCMFPRCEYKTRFEETSAFNMSEPKHWGSYFRSTIPGGNSDRISSTKYTKIYCNENINTPPKNKGIPAAKAGTIYSPWVHEKYKKIFISGSTGPKNNDKTTDSSLYDQLLEYKKTICSAVVEEFSKEDIQDKKINVYYENNYPCVMVQVRGFHEKGRIRGETGSLYKIVIAYFTSITNKVAKTKKIPIELVNRASFGHNIPSVAETDTSFRINIGIVPRMYATEVLVKALKLLNTIFVAPLMNKNRAYKLSLDEDELNSKNTDIQSYNITKAEKALRRWAVAQWAANDDIFDVLCRAGNSSNMKVSFEIMRENEYIDLLTDYVNEEISNIHILDEIILGNIDILHVNLDEEILKDLAEPLRKMLKRLYYSRKRVTLKTRKTDFKKAKLNKFDDLQKPDERISNDRQFWKIIEAINFVFSKHDINILSESIENRRIIGLYRKLEKANLEFIRNSGYQGSEDGFGSDSDCDFRIEGKGTTFHSRKIIVSTGIRAINFAQFLSSELTHTTEADTKLMYYETAEAIKGVTDIYQSLKSGTSKQKKIRYIDLTHCACGGGPNSKVPPLSAKKNEVIVFDCTSATTERISEAIKLIEKARVLLLVSSGLKNEQIGADMNPYGTLRIITQEKETLIEQYSLVKHILRKGKEELPKESHNIRKAYKDAGAVVTSAGIFSNSIGYVYSPNSNSAEYSAKGFEEKSKIFELFFTPEYKEVLVNLNKIHKQDIEEILSWNMDKILFLGSPGVVEACNNNFSEIEEKYEKDPESTERWLNDLMGVRRIETK